MATEDADYWPRRTWAAYALLAGELVVPAALLVCNALVEFPIVSVSDSVATVIEQAIACLFLAHTVYSILLVILMQGWRLAAAGIGFVIFATTAPVALVTVFMVRGFFP
ncbi:unnamed protein product [Gemmataceae bacterium]|nr:unnamed protein product [Gemmataceae bacterium]VTU00334.1 unnamed protein product [Gemmataceae bacterium]